MQVTLWMDPPTATAQMAKTAYRNGRIQHYKPPKVKAATRRFHAGLLPHAPEKPMEGPVELTVLWMFQAKTYKNGSWKISKPDTDNLEKILKDVMTICGYWKDDAQVCSERVYKIWADRPGVIIVAHEIDRDPHFYESEIPHILIGPDCFILQDDEE